DPAGLSDHLLLLPQGLLPLVLRRPAGVCRRRADDPSPLPARDGVSVHPPEPPPVLPVPRVRAAVLPVGRCAAVVPRWRLLADWPWRRDPRAQRRPADGLFAVVPLASPPRRRQGRLLLVHAAGAPAVLAVAPRDVDEC